MRKFSSERILLAVFLAVLLGCLYLLTWDLRPFPIFAPVDDWKYAKDALNIASGNWLGSYDHHTLTKRPMFSVALAIAYHLQIPFMLFLYSFHFVAGGFLSYSLSRCGFSKWFCGALMTAYLFLPMFFDHQATRVIRDHFYVSLQTFILALALFFISIPDETATRGKRVATFFAICFLLAWHWGSREEALTFWPALFPLLIFHVARLSRRSVAERVKYGLLLFTLVATAITSTGFAIRLLNYKNYGMFILMEHEEGDFPKMIGALASVDEGQPESRLWIDWKAREKLSSVLPWFKGVHESFSNPNYDGSVRCRHQRICEAFDLSHQIFAFRDHLPYMDCPKNARGAAAFYRRIRGDVERICAQNLVKCQAPLRSSMMPPFRAYHIPYFIDVLGDHLREMIRVESRGFSREFKTDDNVEWVSKFEELTHMSHYRISPDNQLFGPAPASAEVIRSQDAKRQFLGDLYSAIMPWIGLLALLALALRLRFWRLGGWNLAIVFAIGLTGTIAARILAISYIGAVDWKMSLNYIAPNYGLYLILCFVLIAEGVRVARESGRFKWLGDH